MEERGNRKRSIGDPWQVFNFFMFVGLRILFIHVNYSNFYLMPGSRTFIKMMTLSIVSSKFYHLEFNFEFFIPKFYKNLILWDEYYITQQEEKVRIFNRTSGSWEQYCMNNIFAQIKQVEYFSTLYFLNGSWNFILLFTYQ